MKRRQLKQHILSLLATPDWHDVVSEVQRFGPKNILNHLFTALCSTEEKVKWHAVSCFGIVVPAIARENMEDARIVMRRFLWNLNDESGGIGWGVPEAMAEVMAQEKRLFDEYVHMLISYMREDGPEIFSDGNYLELPALQRGVVWGVGRLLQCRNDEMNLRGVGKDLCHYLESDDPVVIGLAAWGLGMCKEVECAGKLQEFLDVSTSFTLYMNMSLKEVTVSELALKASQHLHSRTV